MDEYSVHLMPKALRDLDEIYSYIAKNLMEPATAATMIDGLEKGILSLNLMPARCAMRRVGAYANKGYRQLQIENYTVVFRIDEGQKRVLIVTVRYSHSRF